jgi:hypothetical protein
MVHRVAGLHNRETKKREPFGTKSDQEQDAFDACFLGQTPF